jgi:hypothetical protein
LNGEKPLLRRGEFLPSSFQGNPAPMFKVIGLDQKEYGPIEAEVVRLWLSQGRLHTQSLILREGDAKWQPVTRFHEFAALAPPPMAAGSSEPANALATIVPYKNGAAVWCGILGLRRAREHPEAKGKVHAWIGIIVGNIFGLLYLALTMMVVFGSVMSARR